SEASVLESPPTKNGLIDIRIISETANVGVAIANPQATLNTINLTLFDQAGSIAATRDITLPAHGHVASFVTELFPQLAFASKFDGALSIHSAAAVSFVALGVSGDKLAALPAAVNGMYRPSITDLRITGTRREGAQVSLQIDVTDLDSDIATSSTTTVLSAAY